MKRLSGLALGIIVLAAGCKTMNETQRPAIVGNSETKVYYQNLAKYESAIPQEKRAYFKSMDAAEADGYHSSQEGGSESPTPKSGDDQ